LYQNSFCTFGQKKTELNRPKANLTLTSRRARLIAAADSKSPLQKHWAAVSAARQNRSKMENRLNLARLYAEARTYFISNC